MKNWIKEKCLGFYPGPDHQIQAEEYCYATQPGGSWVHKPVSSLPPGVSHATFYSESLKREVGYNIFLPTPPVKTPSTRYPTLYWLHSKGRFESDNIQLANPFRRAISRNQIPPAVMVFVNGQFDSMYADSVDRKCMAETAFIRELIPHIETEYEEVEPGVRGIHGYSMGGFGAVKVAFKYPQMFSSVVSYGGAIYDVQTFKTRREVLYDAIFSSDRSAFQDHSPYALLERNSVQIREHLKISLYVGEWDVTYGLNAMFREALKTHNVSHSYQVVKRVSHNLGRYIRRVGCEGFSFSLDHF